MNTNKVSFLTALTLVLFAAGLVHADSQQQHTSPQINDQQLLTPKIIPPAPIDSAAERNEKYACAPLLNHSFRRLGGGKKQKLCDIYRDKVLLVVNTASECGYTYQYEGLENLYQTFAKSGFVVIGFPSNDFGGQEPGSEEEIKLFCQDMYSIDFPMYQKIHAKKGIANPFIKGLAERAKQYPRWNFHKYLLNREGKLVGSWKSRVEPESKIIVERIKRYL